MLFKTIYGAELQSIYYFVMEYGPVDKETIFECFMSVTKGVKGNKANLEDAMGFLTASSLLRKDSSGRFQVTGKRKSFRLDVLENLRLIQGGEIGGSHALDPWFLNFLEKIFILQDKGVQFNLHQHFNTCGAPENLSEEKVNAWKRFMEYLGVGYRLFGGFYCLYSPGLLLEIIQEWAQEEGPLQLFLEEHLEKYLPWQSSRGNISFPLEHSLSYLEEKGHLSLSTKQDLPQLSFLGDRRIKWIKKEVA